MAYDTFHGQTVLFGGEAAVGGTSNETWTWDGFRWTQQSPAMSPAPRRFAQMVYDAAHRQMLMYGGGDQFVSSETWAWNGASWTNLTPPSPALGPKAVDSFALAYDAARQQVVLFGGEYYQSGVGAVVLGETWIWNGSNWTNATPALSPSPRVGVAMAYDSASEQVVLFGGNQAGNDETWAWDGSNWHLLLPSGSASNPPGRFSHSMVYDSTHNQIVLFGGFGSSGSSLNDTWLWNGSTWQSAGSAPAGLVGRGTAGLAYDSIGDQVVLFGGWTGASYVGDMWVSDESGKVPPVAGFTMTSGGQSANEGGLLSLTAPSAGSVSVSFDAGRSSAVTGAAVQAWQWKINNVVASTASSFLHSFAPSANANSISLVVTDDRGATSRPATGTIVVSQAFSSGSTGADGLLDLTSGDQAIQLPPSGTLNYATINIPAGRTLKFLPNANNTPVTLLVQGAATIAGTIDISANGQNPGPGGFAGGDPGSAGAGAGGGPALNFCQSGPNCQGGTWVGPLSLVPNTGGSGGGGIAASGCSTYVDPHAIAGGGGGGAITIASSGSISVSGSIKADGASNQTSCFNGVFFGFATGTSGSGGAIRLVANAMNISGSLSSAQLRLEGPLNGISYSGTGTVPVLAPVGTSVIPETYAPVELIGTPLYSDPSLISYWRFEGNAVDSKGSNNGSATNISYGSSYGKFGQGASCSGSSTIAIQDAAVLDPSSALTISAWVHPTASSSSNERVIAKSDSSDPGGRQQWAIYTNAYSGCCTVSGNIVGQINTSNVSAMAITDVVRSAASNNWTLLTLTYDGAHVITYINGVPRASVPATGALSPLSGDSPGRLNICSANSLTGTFFQGYVDDVAIFSRALSADEVAGLYTGSFH
jgi:hypothetical protein